MPIPPPAPPARLDAVREAACLAHTVPGVTLRLQCPAGDDVLVSYACLGADLDPCQLRAALMAIDSGRSEPELLWGFQVTVEVVAGLRPLGGGLYQRTQFGLTERWFVTTLEPDAVVAAVGECPLAAADQVHVVVKPDLDLGVHAVCVRIDDSAEAGHLDELATWVLGRVLVAELLAGLPRSIHETHSPRPRAETDDPA
jgi:hypothetical protein